MANYKYLSEKSKSYTMALFRIEHHRFQKAMKKYGRIGNLSKMGFSETEIKQLLK